MTASSFSSARLMMPWATWSASVSGESSLLCVTVKSARP